MADLAPALWGIPVVSSATERGALFPIPSNNQRVHNLATGYIERWTGVLWAVDFGADPFLGGFYNVKALPTSATGDGSTDDRGALNTLANTTIPLSGGTMYFPAGTYRIGSALTIPANVTCWFAQGAKLSIDTGITVSMLGPLMALRNQIFSGLGNVSFLDSNGVSPVVDTVYPEWWGALPGNGLGGAVDCSAGVTKATRCGVRRVLFGEGTYKFLSTVTIAESPTCPNDLVLEGVSKTATILQAGQATLGAPNALFINVQNNGKLSWRHLRFSGQSGVSAFTGYAIYALENGASSQCIFSGEIDDCWIGMGTTSAGFFYGALNNYLVRNCTFEGTQTRFTVAGAGFSDVHFENNSDYGCLDPFIDMATDATIKNIVSICGLHAYSPQRGPLIKANNCESLTLADIIYQVADASTPGTTLGLLDLTNCKRLQISNCKATRYPASTANMNRAVKLNGCSGKITNLHIDGGDYNMEIQGATDLEFATSWFLYPSSFNLRFVAATSGKVKFAACRFQYSLNGCINFQTAGSTVDLLFESCDLLDALYGAGAAGYGSYFASQGRVRFLGGRIGRTTNVAATTAWAALTAYVEGDMRSDGGVNYVCWAAHTSSAAGAGGNEPGVGATWQTYWRKHVANMNAVLYLDEVLGTFAIEGTELLDTSVLLRHASSTQTIKSQRWLNTINGISADKGDTSPTITALTDPETILFNTPITANRTVTLVWVAGVKSKFRVVRTAAATGAFTIDVGGLKTIPAGTAASVDVEYDGAVARLTGYGTL